jgi:hypothetical protein
MSVGHKLRKAGKLGLVLAVDTAIAVPVNAIGRLRLPGLEPALQLQNAWRTVALRWMHPELAAREDGRA